ncbi:MAG: hypothetical protein ACLU4J_03845 [Butyricimonas paravirosa]
MAIPYMHGYVSVADKKYTNKVIGDNRVLRQTHGISGTKRRTLRFVSLEEMSSVLTWQRKF